MVAESRESAQAKSSPIIVGRIGAVYGVKGWLKIISDTQPLENILRYRPWLLKLNGRWVETEIEDAKTHGKGLVAKIRGCDDRELARNYTNAEIGITREQLPKPQQGEYYWADLEGLEVVNLEGINFGKIDHLFETGANDVIVVKGDEERLVPFIMNDVIKEIDLDKQHMLVDWPSEF